MGLSDRMDKVWYASVVEMWGGSMYTMIGVYGVIEMQRIGVST